MNADSNVYTTMNVQHLESLNDQVWRITGIRIRETIPDWVVRQADEIVMIDLTPRAIPHRLERGLIYRGEKAQRALENFFRKSSLGALRELTLREAAHEVEYRSEIRQPDGSDEERVRALRRKHHKLLVLVTADARTAMVVRRARRVSDFPGAECLAVALRDVRAVPARAMTYA